MSIWAVFGPLWTCFSADCLGIWHKHTYGRDAPNYAKKFSRSNDVMTLWRHKCQFGRFLGHCGRFLGHCGRVSRPIALKFSTNIHMVEMHQFMRKEISRRNDVMTLLRHKCQFGRFLGHCGRVSRPIALKFGTNIHMVEMNQFMQKKFRDATTSWRYDVITTILGHFSQLLAHCERDNGPIALKFGTNLHMTETHEFIKKNPRRNDAINVNLGGFWATVGGFWATVGVFLGRLPWNLAQTYIW